MSVKRIIFISVLAIGLILLAACAVSTPDAASDEQPPPNEQTPINEIPDIPVEITPTEETDPSTTSETEQETATEQLSDENTENETNNAPDPKIPATGEVVISFEYTRQSGPASNQHAVWIEDMEGNLIKSLFASRWTANGGFRTRPDSIALWTEIADPANMETADIDAIAGVTPRAGLQSYTWDLTDLNGETVLKGDYRFFVEGTLRWKNFVLISGVIRIGDEPETVQGDAVFHYEGTDRYPELTDDSTENNMIGAVTAVFIP